MRVRPLLAVLCLLAGAVSPALGDADFLSVTGRMTGRAVYALHHSPREEPGMLGRIVTDGRKSEGKFHSWIEGDGTAQPRTPGVIMQSSKITAMSFRTTAPTWR